MRWRRQMTRSDRLRRRGAAGIELALIAPLLVALMLGTSEVGHVLRVHAILTGAARKGCSAGSLPGRSNADVIRGVQSALENSGLPTGSVAIAIQVNDQPGEVATAHRNDKISVSVTIPASAVAWTGSFVFVRINSLRSQTTAMLRQG